MHLNSIVCPTDFLSVLALSTFLKGLGGSRAASLANPCSSYPKLLEETREFLMYWNRCHRRCYVSAFTAKCKRTCTDDGGDSGTTPHTMLVLDIMCTKCVQSVYDVLECDDVRACPTSSGFVSNVCTCV